MELKIEYLPIGELKTYANNAKIHTAEQIEQIKNSIQEFGFNDPIAVWKDNEIIEGHGRLIAAQELGLETIPVIRLDSLTDEQRRAYALAHNKLTMNTDFDINIVGIEIESILDIDLTDLGFSEAEILELTIDDSPAITPYSVPSDEAIGFERESRQDLPSSYMADEFKRELDKYEAHANDSGLVTKRVILIYRNESEMEFIKSLLRIKPENDLNVVYDIRDIMGVQDAESEK